MKFPRSFARKANVNSQSLLELTKIIINTPAKKLNNLRGELGETILHWAAITDDGLIHKCISNGMDINAVDKFGQTPLDWLINRSYLLSLEKDNQMRNNILTFNQRGLDDTISQATSLAPTIISFGGNSSVSEESHTPICLRMMKAGLGILINTYVDKFGKKYLFNWVNGSNALHFWALTPETNYKAELLVHLSEFITPELHQNDNNGNNPAHYAALSLRDDNIVYKNTIKELTFMTLSELNIDIFHKNKSNERPYDIYPLKYLE